MLHAHWYRALVQAHLLGGSFAASRSAGRGNVAQEKGAPPCEQILMDKSRNTSGGSREGRFGCMPQMTRSGAGTQTHVAC